MSVPPLGQPAHHYDEGARSPRTDAQTLTGDPGFTGAAQAQGGTVTEDPEFSAADNGYDAGTHTGVEGTMPGRDTTGAALDTGMGGGEERTSAAGLAGGVPAYEGTGTGAADSAAGERRPEGGEGHGLVRDSAGGAGVGASVYDQGEQAPYGERAPQSTMDQPREGLSGADSSFGGRQEHEHGLVRDSTTGAAGVGAATYSAGEPAPYGETAPQGTTTQPRTGLAGREKAFDQGSENAARRDDGFVNASEGGTEEGQGPGAAGSRFAEGGSVGTQGAGGSGLGDSAKGYHAGPKLAAGVESTGRERELRAERSGDGAGAQGTDYVPDHTQDGVYTADHAPHGYPTTGAQKPTGMNDMALSENIKQMPEGGVALHGKEGLPEGKPSAIDKLVGKVQQEIGRQTNNWELHGKGVLREAGGSKAAKGEARAVI